jgi:hypothetical protein
VPTYLNTSHKVEFADPYTFEPNKEQKTAMYLSTTMYPNLKLISDEPLPKKTFKLALENVNSMDDLSEISDLSRKIIINVRDGEGGECNAGDKVTITVFGGDAPYLDQFSHISSCEFERMSYGNGLWSCLSNNNIISNLAGFKFYSVAVTSIAIAGYIDIYKKDI